VLSRLMARHHHHHHHRSIGTVHQRPSPTDGRRRHRRPAPPPLSKEGAPARCLQGGYSRMAKGRSRPCREGAPVDASRSDFPDSTGLCLSHCCCSSFTDFRCGIVSACRSKSCGLTQRESASTSTPASLNALLQRVTGTSRTRLVISSKRLVVVVSPYRRLVVVCSRPRLRPNDDRDLAIVL